MTFYNCALTSVLTTYVCLLNTNVTAYVQTIEKTMIYTSSECSGQLSKGKYIHPFHIVTGSVQNKSINNEP